MLDILEFNYGRYNGGQTAPIGSYLNPRTMAIFQQVSDGTLPQDGRGAGLMRRVRRRLRISRRP